MNVASVLALLRTLPAGVVGIYVTMLLTGRSIASVLPLIVAGGMALAYVLLSPVTFVTAVLRLAALQILAGGLVLVAGAWVLAINAQIVAAVATALAAVGLLLLLGRLPGWLWEDG